MARDEHWKRELLFFTNKIKNVRTKQRRQRSKFQSTKVAPQSLTYSVLSPGPGLTEAGNARLWRLQLCPVSAAPPPLPLPWPASPPPSVSGVLTSAISKDPALSALVGYTQAINAAFISRWLSTKT